MGKLRIRLKNPLSGQEDDNQANYQDYQSSSIDQLPRLIEQKFNGLDLVIQRNRGVYLNAKIINLDD